MTKETVTKSRLSKLSFFGKKKSSKNSSKVYWRNCGKGHLDYLDNTLKFYLKGGFTKNPEATKVIPIGEIEEISLENAELTFTWKGNTERLVVDDKALAQIILEETNIISEESSKSQYQSSQLPSKEQPVNKLLEPPNLALGSSEPSKPSQELVLNCQVEPEFGITVTKALSAVDSLFDVLGSLHGYVDWNRTRSHLKFIEKDLKIIAGKTTTVEKIDFSLLTSAISQHDAELVKKESYRLLEAIYKGVRKSPPENEPLSNTRKLDLEDIIEAYYLLNDIALAAIVSDKNVLEEVSELATKLDIISKQTKTTINVKEIISSVNKLSQEPGRELFVEEARGFFKKQLNLDSTMIERLEKQP